MSSDEEMERMDSSEEESSTTTEESPERNQDRDEEKQEFVPYTGESTWDADENWCLRQDCNETIPRWVWFVLLALLCLLCICMLCTLAILLAIFLGIIPAVIRSNVENANLVIERFYLEETGSKRFNEFGEREVGKLHLVASGKITDAGSFDATIHGFDITTEYKGEVVGKVRMGGVDITANEDSRFTIDDIVTIPDVDYFTEVLGNEIINGDFVTLRFSGKPTISAIGLDFEDIDFDKKVKLQALNYDEGENIILGQPNVVDATSNTLSLEVKVKVKNPSKFAVSLDSINLNIYLLSGLYFGSGAITNFVLDTESHSENTYNSTVLYVDPTDSGQFEEARVFLSGFLRQEDQQVTLLGPTPNTTSILERMLSHINTTVTLEGIAKPLIVSSRIASIDLGASTANITLLIRNPFDVRLDVTYIDVDVTLDKFGNTYIGSVTEDLTANPISLAPGRQTNTPPVVLDLNGLSGALSAFIAILAGGGSTTVTVDGPITAKIDRAYTNVFDYRQEGIKTNLL